MSERNIKIVLNSMFKNEAAVVERMLNSVYKYIDYWVIQDNGSTDGTQEIVTNFFKEKNIPGVLYYEPWQYFGYNRNHALQKCLQTDHGCEYILRMDADEILQVDDSFDWNQIRSNDAWNIIGHTTDIDFFRMWMWKANLPWYFADDRRHETIHMKDDQPYSCANLPSSFRHVLMGGGNTWVNPYKFFIDALELENQVVVKQKGKDLYHLFYLAKSYHDSIYGETLVHELDHTKEMCRRAEFYFTKYIKAQIPSYPNVDLYKLQLHDEYVYYAFYLMGNMYELIGEYDKAVEYWKKGAWFDKSRNETLLKLCSHYLYRMDDIPNLYIYANIAVRNKNPFPQHRAVWVERESYVDTGWKALDFHAIGSYHMGYYDEAKTASELLLSDAYKSILPETQVERVKVNLKFTQEKV